jgi:hypothetical protein
MAENLRALLDNLRFSSGPAAVRNYFAALMWTDNEQGLRLINDPDLCFGTLYLLRNEVNTYFSGSGRDRTDLLNPLYLRALDTADVLADTPAGRSDAADGAVSSQSGEAAGSVGRTGWGGPNKRTARQAWAGRRDERQRRAWAAMKPADVQPEYEKQHNSMRKGWAERQSIVSMRNDNDLITALQWMLRSGSDENGLGELYGQLMDNCACLLPEVHRDMPVLESMSHMIFQRHREGRLIHELVRAFFEARRLESLPLLAQGLLSANSRDVELAKRLLCFIPCIRRAIAGRDEAGSGLELSGADLYACSMEWLNQNKPFLYYTGENLHLSGYPMHYTVLEDSGAPGNCSCSNVDFSPGQEVRYD